MSDATDVKISRKRLGRIDSEAFARAMLRSERYRIAALLVIVCGLSVFAVIRTLMSDDPYQTARLWVSLIALAIAAAYELLMLVVAIRAHRAGQMLPAWVWRISTIIDSLLPTFGLLLVSDVSPTVAPLAAVYFFFIILSTLRLSPMLCLLSGVVSGAGYAVVCMVTRVKYAGEPQALSIDVLAGYAMALVAGGVVAAMVAGQIRKHVIAALREVEAHRQVERFEQDLEIARSIQRALLPVRPPLIDGYEIAGWTRPAEFTGGDYYDWIELPGGNVILTVADVAGHGVGPALLVAACRAYFRAVATNNDPLEKIAQQIDALLAADVSEGRFVTSAIALLEPAKNRLLLYSAGHGPMYFYSASENRVTMLEADQPPLGIALTEATTKARVIPMCTGDTLVLLTDGFFEWKDPEGKMLGIHGMSELITKHRAMPAEQIIRTLHDEVVEFSRGTRQGDDLTAVVLKRNGVPN